MEKVNLPTICGDVQTESPRISVGGEAAHIAPSLRRAELGHERLQGRYELSCETPC